MAGGVIVGVLRERHEDHIVLENGTKIFLTSKQTAGGLSPGTSLTVAYTAKRDGPESCGQHLERALMNQSLTRKGRSPCSNRIS